MEQDVNIGTPVMSTIDNKPKGGNGLKIATVVACVMAVCGIGFGVYGMMQSSQKDSQIDELKVQVNSNDGAVTVIDNSEKIPAGTFLRNPILVSNEELIVSELFESDDSFNEKRSIIISVADGNITGCSVLKASSDGYGKTAVGDCTISGVSGKVSAVSEMGSTQMTWPYIGFLMEDGTVEYISSTELADNLSASVKGKLLFEGNKPVTSIISGISVRSNNSEGAGGYQTTAFYHSDGSFSLFNDSMVSD